MERWLEPARRPIGELDATYPIFPSEHVSARRRLGLTPNDRIAVKEKPASQ